MKKTLLKKIKKELGTLPKEQWDEVKKNVNNTAMDDFKFYLTSGKVHICFGSYELLYNGAYEFSISSIYQ